MRGKRFAALWSLSVLVVGACAGTEGGTNGEADPETVSATEYVTGM
jgi:hypothetical protein